MAFPLRLSLRDDNGLKTYSLTALILHPTNHFLAFTRDPATGLWYSCNDASVSPIPTPLGEAFSDPKAVFAAYALTEALAASQETERLLTRTKPLKKKSTRARVAANMQVKARL